MVRRKPANIPYRTYRVHLQLLHLKQACHCSDYYSGDSLEGSNAMEHLIVTILLLAIQPGKLIIASNSKTLRLITLVPVYFAFLK